GQIGDNRQRLTAFALDALHDLGDFACGPSRDGNAGSLARQGQGNRPANAPPAACHQGHAILKLLHKEISNSPNFRSPATPEVYPTAYGLTIILRPATIFTSSKKRIL